MDFVDLESVSAYRSTNGPIDDWIIDKSSHKEAMADEVFSYSQQHGLYKFAVSENCKRPSNNSTKDSYDKGPITSYCPTPKSDAAVQTVHEAKTVSFVNQPIRHTENVVSKGLEVGLENVDPEQMDSQSCDAINIEQDVLYELEAILNQECSQQIGGSETLDNSQLILVTEPSLTLCNNALETLNIITTTHHPNPDMQDSCDILGSNFEKPTSTVFFNQTIPSFVTTSEPTQAMESVLVVLHQDNVSAVSKSTDAQLSGHPILEVFGTDTCSVELKSYQNQNESPEKQFQQIKNPTTQTIDVKTMTETDGFMKQTKKRDIPTTSRSKNMNSVRNHFSKDGHGWTWVQPHNTNTPYFEHLTTENDWLNFLYLLRGMVEADVAIGIRMQKFIMAAMGYEEGKYGCGLISNRLKRFKKAIYGNVHKEIKKCYSDKNFSDSLRNAVTNLVYELKLAFGNEFSKAKQKH